MKINLSQFGTNQNYFSILINDMNICTSENIANLFNLDTDFYNKLLIEKVIKHDRVFISKHCKDLEFNLCNIPKEIYKKRFEDVFADQLILLALEGGKLNEN